jgi:hypothetical protein
MKLDLAAVEATAGGKEGTVICAKRAEGRVARTNWSGAAGVACAVAVSATGATAGVGVATFLTVIDFTSGTEVAFFGDDTVANLALEAGVGLEAAATALGATGTAALVLTAVTFGVTTTNLGALLVLAGVLTALVLTAADGAALTAVFSFTAGLVGAAVLAETDFLAGAALTTWAFAGAATFFFEVVTSCLLAV